MKDSIDELGLGLIECKEEQMFIDAIPQREPQPQQLEICDSGFAISPPAR